MPTDKIAEDLLSVEISTSGGGPVSIDIARFLVLVKDKVGHPPLAVFRRKRRLKLVFASKDDRDTCLALSSFMYQSQRLHISPWQAKPAVFVMTIGNLHTPLPKVAHTLQEQTGGSLPHLEREKIAGVFTERVFAIFKDARPSFSRFLCGGKHYSITPLTDAEPSRTGGEASTAASKPADIVASPAPSDTFVFLVSARRPLSLADENAGETSLVLLNTYNWLTKERGFPADHVFVFGADGDERRFVEAHRERRFLQADPATFLESFKTRIPGRGNSLFVFIAGHGATDKVGSLDAAQLPVQQKRGLQCAQRPHHPDSDRWWLLFPHAADDLSKIFTIECDTRTSQPVRTPKGTDNEQDTTAYSLHWQALRRTLTEVTSGADPKLRNVVFFVGACCSGGLFRWLPEHSLDAQGMPLPAAASPITSQLPIYAMTSADEDYMSGTWFWYEWLRLAESSLKRGERITLAELYQKIHRQDPQHNYDTRYPGAVGEPLDALLVSQFYGAEGAKDLTLDSIFPPGGHRQAPNPMPAARNPPPESLDFLQRLFDQVRLERWYPVLEKYTYKTVSVALAEAEALALLHMHEEKKGTAHGSSSLPIMSEEEHRLLRQLEQRLDSIIGGQFSQAAFVKLSHRSPKDALLDARATLAWFGAHVGEYEDTFNGRLACMVAAYHVAAKVASGKRALKLLSLSDRVAGDLEWALASSAAAFDLRIVVREYCNVEPHTEFRGFVSHGRLTAVSQYHYIIFFPQLPAQKDAIGARLMAFYEGAIGPLLGQAIDAQHFVIDFHVLPDSIRVIELNPFETSDFFLFHPIEDQQRLEHGPFEMRVTEKANPRVVETGNVHEGWLPLLLPDAAAAAAPGSKASRDALVHSHSGLSEHQKSAMMAGGKVYTSQEVVNLMNSFPCVPSPMAPILFDSYKKGAEPQRSEFVRQFSENIRVHGYAVITLNSLEEYAPIERMFADLKAFMERPDEEKAALLLNKNDAGYAVAPGMFEQFKFVNIGDIASQTTYPWPHAPPTFKSSCLAYHELMDGLARTLVSVLGEGCGFNKEEVYAILDATPLPPGILSNGDLRLFRYFKPSQYDRAYAGEIHADIGVLTLIPIAAQSGLEVFDRKVHKWMQVENSHFPAHSIVLFAGDVTRALTGGYVQAAPHRVKLPSDVKNARYSMPFILRPRDEAQIRTLRWTAFKNEIRPQHVVNSASYVQFYQQSFRTCLCSPSWKFIPPY